MNGINYEVPNNTNNNNNNNNNNINNNNNKPSGKRAFGKPKRRWEYNIRIDFIEIGISRRNWIDLAQDRDYRRALASSALNLQSISQGVS